MQALLWREQQIIRELHDLRREEQKARRAYRQDMLRSRAVTAGRLTEWHRQQLLRLLSIADCAVDVAIACVDHASHPPPWAGLSLMEKRTVMNDVVLMHTAAEVTAWTDATNVGNQRALLPLWTLWAEYQVAEWVRHVNQARGVAPSSALVYERLQEHLAAAPPSLSAQLLRARSLNARRHWAMRWRKRWGGAMGTLALGDVDDPGVVQNKASAAHKPHGWWQFRWPVNA